MKVHISLIGIFLLANIITIECTWEIGKQYKYRVSTQALSGISRVNKYAGVQFTFDQIITPIGNNVVNVKTENLKGFEVNEKLEQGQANDGREAQIPSQLRAYITSPMDMTIKDGVVNAIRVPRNIPTWAINIKKAQASTFTSDAGNNAIVEGNLNHHPEEANDESGLFYKVLEATVHGECEVYYTVSQTSPLNFHNHILENVQPADEAESGSQETRNSTSSDTFDSLCGEDDEVYEIVKTVNFTTCVQNPVLAFSSPAGQYFHPGDNAGGTLWTRTLLTRLLACGQSRHNYTILNITQHEHFQTGLTGEEVVADAVKNVNLISIQSGEPTLVRNPRVITNLVYEFDPMEQREQLEKRTGQLERQSISEEEVDEVFHFRKWSNSAELLDVQGYALPGGEYSNGYSEGQDGRSRFSPFSFRHPDRGESVTPPGPLRQPTMDEAPVASLLVTSLNHRQLMAHAQALIRNIVRDLTVPTQSSGDSIAKRDILSKITALVKTLRVLDFQDLEQLARKFIRREPEEGVAISRKIFLDALTISGTNPSVKLLSSLIRTEQVKGEEAAQALSSLPLYVRTPTEPLLQEVFRLLENDFIRSNLQTHTSAILAFTSLAHQACVDKKIKNTRYPVALYGEFCQPELVRKEFTPYFITKLEKSLDANQGPVPSVAARQSVFVYLKALANLGVPEIIPTIQRILDEPSEPIIKVKAIHALEYLLQSRSGLNLEEHEKRIPADRQSYDVVTDEVVEKSVLPILVSVAFDRGEHPEVRIAAFSSLFYCTSTDTAIFQQSALSTWSEQVRDVHAFIFSTLMGLAELQEPLTGARLAQVQNARQVVPLLKPIDASVARSRSVFTSQFFQGLNLGFSQHLQYTASQDSLTPNNFYYKPFFQLGNGAVGFSPFEIGLSGQTISKTIQALYKGLDTTVVDQPSPPPTLLDKIRKTLSIGSRNGHPVVANLFVNLLNQVQRLWTFDAFDAWKLKDFHDSMKRNLSKGIQVKYQKVALMSEQATSMATILGIPLVYEESQPSLLSIRGSIKTSNIFTSPDVHAQADVSVIYASRLHRNLAFKCPLTRKKYQAGMQRSFTVELPVSAAARQGRRGQVQLALTPMHPTEGAPKGTIEFVTYERKPYTATIHDEFYPILDPSAGQVEIAAQAQSSQTHSFGQTSLGLHLEIQEKSEDLKEGKNPSRWASFFKQFQSVAFNAASPASSFVERRFVLDLDKSETKTLVTVTGASLRQASIAEEPQADSEDYSVEYSSEGQQSFSTESLGWEEAPPGDNVIAVALLGKSAPLLSLKEQEATGEPTPQLTSSEEELEQYEQGTTGQASWPERPLAKGSRSTVQYFLHLSQTPTGTVLARVSVGDAAKEAVKSLPPSRPLQVVREAVAEFPSREGQSNACIEFQGNFTAPPGISTQVIAYTRRSLLESDMFIKVSATLQAGTNCRSMPFSVKVEGQLRRDQEMTEWAQSKSPKAQRCQADEKMGLFVSGNCLEVASEEAAALNEIDLTIEHSEMPVALKNFARKLETLVKTLGYLYLSEDQQPRSSPVPPNQIKLWGRITPNKEFLSFHIYQPGSILKFEKMRTNEAVRSILPPTSTNTIVGNVQRRLLRSQYHPTCQLEGNHVSTFDSLTYSFNQNTVQGCQTLLAEAHSTTTPVAVFLKNIQYEFPETLTILLGSEFGHGEDKIELIPPATEPPSRKEGRKSSGTPNIDRSRLAVRVNDKAVHLPLRILGDRRNQHPVAELLETPFGGVIVIGRSMSVFYDGERVVLQADGSLRSRMFGICGDFNGEKLAEMRSPRDVPLSSGSVLIASSSFDLPAGDNATVYSQSQAECEVKWRYQRQVEEEEEAFLESRFLVEHE